MGRRGLACLHARQAPLSFCHLHIHQSVCSKSNLTGCFALFVLEINIMSFEEPSLPPLKAIAWDQHRQSISNPLKRVRPARLPSLATSSDPAVFSSDDDPDVTNYVEGRRKKRYVGSWFQHNRTSSDSAFSEDRPPLPAMKAKRTFERNVDSGVYLASDGAESDSFESLDMSIQDVPRDAVPAISAAERSLRAKVDACLESGEETIDFWAMDLDELSGDTVAPLSQFSRIPQVTKDVEFVQEDPHLELYLSQNRIARLPGALFDITHLTILSLRGNQLTEIPPAIYKLKNLLEVNLSQNRLQHLPVEMLDLLKGDGKLRTLVIWPNPCFLPADDFPPLDKAEERGLEEHFGADGGLQRSGAPTNGGSSVPRLITRRLGRSPVKSYTSMGNVTSTFTFPTLDAESLAKERLPVDTRFKPMPTSQQEESSEPVIAGASGMKMVNRAPSLAEAVMRQIQDNPHLPSFTGYIPEELPQLRRLLEQCIRQTEAGGIVCSQCRKAIVVPVAEWVEWREVCTVARRGTGLDEQFQITSISQAEDERWVPFLHRACSRACGPKEHHTGWEVLRE